MNLKRSSFLVARLDAERRYTYVDAAVQYLTGHDPSDLLGKTCKDLDMPAGFCDLWNRAYEQALETGTPVSERVPSIPERAGCCILTFIPEPAVNGSARNVLVIGRDDADLTTARDALRDSQQYLADVLEHARDVIYRLDLRTGRYDYLSPSVEAVTGFTLEEMCELGAEGLWTRTHPQDRSQTMAGLHTLMDQANHAGRNEILEFRFRHKNGEYVWLSDARTVVRDHTGRPIAIIGSLRDISTPRRVATQREQLLIDLDAAHTRQEQIVWQMPIGVAMTDTRGRITLANQEAVRLLGQPIKDAIARRYSVFRGARHPDGRLYDRDEYPHLRSLRTGEIVRGEEMHYMRDDGTMLILSVTSAPILDTTGSIMATSITFIDMTERRRAERALRESEERFHAAMARFPGVLAIYDGEGRIQFINSAGTQGSDRPQGDLLGHRDEEVYPQQVAEAYLPALRQALETGTVQRLEQTLPPEHGGATLVREFVPLLDDKGRVAQMLGIAYDITERKRMEQELEALTENLEQRVLERTAQLRRLASELIQTEQRERRHLAQLLHDHLQQLLVAAQLRVSLVGRQIPDRNQQLLVEQVGNLLGESIGVSRSLSVELSPPVLDLGLSPALEWLARWMKEKYGLQIEVTVDEAASPAEENVRAFLFQAARELLFNVVKHAEVHDARLELHRHGEDEVVLSVVDRGAGFDLPRQMLEPTLTGLGLFSIRERLELLGGRVDIDSVPGQGTCVTLYAPISGSLVDKGDIRTREESRSSGRSHRRDGDITGSETARGEGRIRLLLVDDHPILRQGLATMFETEPDVEVIGEAGDGYEALEMVRRLEPDVVLMDVTMPGMDGIEATRLIKADYPDVDVIGLSMHQEGDVSARMHSAGARAFVTKGGNTDALLRAIRGFRDPRPCYV